MAAPLIVNDVTGLNPVPVWAIATPTTTAEVQAALADTNVPLSVGGGHFSMGGQTASPGSLHIDMRRMNRVLHFSPELKRIRVQAGIRWCDIQKFIDPHGLAISIMQTYANFTVGGALSVNCHGRYIGMGPVVLSVVSIKVALVGGKLVDATPQSNPEIFYGCIGGYGALGVIVEVELDLARNCRLARISAIMPLEDYAKYFREHVRNAPGVVFHNADLYAPHFKRVRAVSWVETTKPATTRLRLQWQRGAHLLEKYFGQLPKPLTANGAVSIWWTPSCTRRVPCTGATTRLATTWRNLSRCHAPTGRTYCRNISFRCLSLRAAPVPSPPCYNGIGSTP